MATQAKDPVQLVNEREKMARGAMSHQVEVWRSAADSFMGKGPVQKAEQVNIKINRLVADVETVVPRFAGNILGTRPYMPIRSELRQYARWATGIEALMDHFAARGQFFLSFTEALRYSVALGLGYVEPRYEFWPYNVYQRNPQYDDFGRIVGYDEFRETSIKEGMKFVVHHPMAIRPHPHGNTLSEKPWIIIVELVPVADIERMIDQGTYKLKAGVKKNDLRKREPLDSELAFEMRRDKSAVTGDLQDDVGVLMRMYANDRWIHTWNRTMVLMDTENQNQNMYLWQKPVAALRNISHIGPDRWWPIGMHEHGRTLAKWGDKILSRYFQDVMMGSAQLMLYNPELVNREDLIAEPGNRIPVEQGDFERAVYPIKTGQPDKSLFDLYTITQDVQDTLKGLFDYQRGSTPARKETATTTQTLAQAGNTRLEFGVLQIEQTGLEEIAYLTVKMLDANVTRGAVNEILGFEEAQFVPSLDPEMIPGGFAFHFEGSDRVQRKTQKVEMFTQVYNMLRPQPTIQQGAWVLDRKLALLTETLSDEELNQMGLSEESQAQQQQMMAMQEQQSMMGAAPSLGSGGGTVMPPGQVATPASNQEMAVQVA